MITTFVFFVGALVALCAYRLGYSDGRDQSRVEQLEERLGKYIRDERRMADQIEEDLR